MGAGVCARRSMVNESGKPCFWKRFDWHQRRTASTTVLLDIKSGFCDCLSGFGESASLAGNGIECSGLRITYCNGFTGVFLDPPIPRVTSSIRAVAQEAHSAPSARVGAGSREAERHAWCSGGERRRARITGMGAVVQWKAGGGWQRRWKRRGRNGNRNRERL